MNKMLNVKFHFTTGGIEELTRCADSNNFRWIRGSFGVPVGMNYLDKQTRGEGFAELCYQYFNDLCLSVTRTVTQRGVEEKYTYKNNSDKPVKLTREEYGITATFADGYDIEAVALPRRAYCKVFCSENTMCVYNSRMNGAPDGVGLVLTSGELGGYTCERHGACGNSEYVFLLPEKTLEVGEEFFFSWLLFAYDGLEEYKTIISEFMPTPVFEALNPLPCQTIRINSNGADIYLKAPSNTDNACPITDEAIDTCTNNCIDKESTVEAQPEGAGYTSPEVPQSAQPATSDALPHASIICLATQADAEYTFTGPCTLVTVKNGKRMSLDFVPEYPWEREARLFRTGLFRRKNPYQRITTAYNNLRTFTETKDKGYAALAAMDVISYFTQCNGNRRFDQYLPTEAIMQSPEATAFLLYRAEQALLPNKKRFSPQVLLGKYDILCKAITLQDRAEFRQKAQELLPLCLAYLQTPFGLNCIIPT